MWDFTSANNTTKAYILLVKTLLRTIKKNNTTSKVNGEAFNITNNQSHLF